MKVYYDFQILRVQKYGGISRYFYELYNHINDNKMAQVKVGCLFNRNRYFEDICGIKEGTNNLNWNVCIPWRVLFFLILSTLHIMSRIF